MCIIWSWAVPDITMGMHILYSGKDSLLWVDWITIALGALPMLALLLGGIVLCLYVVQTQMFILLKVPLVFFHRHAGVRVRSIHILQRDQGVGSHKPHSGLVYMWDSIRIQSNPTSRTWIEQPNFNPGINQYPSWVLIRVE